MKISDFFVLSTIGDEHFVVPIGEKKADFEAIFKLNETGKFIWEALTKEIDEDALIERFAAQFSVDNETATKDVTDFIAFLREKKILE